MAEDRESRDRKHEKSKKRDRPKRVDPNVWSTDEKLQLAEAIDMYGVTDVKRLTARVPTKKFNQVNNMLRQLRMENRKAIECQDMNTLRFVDLNAMNDLFLAGGTKPKDVMVKWMEYLETFYNNDPYQFDKFKLFSSAFLIMAECTTSPPLKINATANTTKDRNGNGGGDDDDDGSTCEIDFKKVYYFLYRVFNNYYVSKNHRDSNMRQYLYELFLRVLEDIEYTSDNEKIAMYNVVSSWTSVSRMKNTKVYGNASKIDDEEEDTKPKLKKTEYKVLEQPMIPSFNPLRIKSHKSETLF